MRDLNIAYGNSCMAKKWSNKTITFGELCGRLENTIRTTETVEEYQKMKRAEREAAKDKGGFVGGQLKGGRRKRENVVSRSMLTMDVDKGEKGFIESYEMLTSYTSVLYMLLPERWEKMDLYARRSYINEKDGPTVEKGTVKREYVSNVEIWSECFGRSPSDMKPADSYSIAALMTQIPGWERSKDCRKKGIYGKQRVYVRTEEQEK